MTNTQILNSPTSPAASIGASNDQTAKAAAADDLAQLTKKPTESFADIAEEFEEEQEDFQTAYNAGGSFAQKLDEIAKGYGGGRKGGVEMEPHSMEASRDKPPEDITEVLTEPELEKKPELEGFIEKVEKAGETQQVVIDDYTQQVLLKTAGQNTKVKLPLTEDQIQKGLHQQVWDSIRWLAEWCVRQMKMLKEKVMYKDQVIQ